MKKQRMTLLLLTTIMLFLLSAINVSADTVTSIKVDKVVSKIGGSVSIPIQLSGNTGICGASISIQYDERLVLTGIDTGTALSELSMTKPGNMSANPIKLVWDGLDADNTNGTLATLTFNVPKDVGVYNISVSYADGDIVDENLSPINVYSENGSITVSGEEQSSDPFAIIVENEIVAPNSQVKVPISISGNTGICGAVLSVSYDNALILTDISEGTALYSLNMTKPGNLSLNPFKLVWDGLEADNTNGIIAVLTFTVPSNTGDYNIFISYDEGDIVDGNLNPVDVKTEQGQIKVGNPKSIVIEIDDKKTELIGYDDMTAEVIVAFYNDNGTLITVERQPADNSIIKFSNTDNAPYAKVMLWESLDTLKPVCNAQTVNLK